MKRIIGDVGLFIIGAIVLLATVRWTLAFSYVEPPVELPGFGTISLAIFSGPLTALLVEAWTIYNFHAWARARTFKKNKTADERVHRLMPVTLAFVVGQFVVAPFVQVPVIVAHLKGMTIAEVILGSIKLEAALWVWTALVVSTPVLLAGGVATGRTLHRMVDELGAVNSRPKRTQADSPAMAGQRHLSKRKVAAILQRMDFDRTPTGNELVDMLAAHGYAVSDRTGRRILADPMLRTIIKQRVDGRERER